MIQDSFYIDPATLPPTAACCNGGGERAGGAARARSDVLLRTHTSPMQVRAMESQEPPIFIVVPGTVYRRDTIDATHLPMFHQVEGLAVGEGISLADLAGTLEHAARALFGAEREDPAQARTTSRSPSRASRSTSPASPATAPERCPSGERDSLCKGTGWIEILGAGMVDPNVFGFVDSPGYDPETTRASRSGWGSSGSRCSSTGSPTCGCSSRTTSGSWSSSR